MMGYQCGLCGKKVLNSNEKIHKGCGGKVVIMEIQGWDDTPKVIGDAFYED
jgi:hypothetical protein